VESDRTCASFASGTTNDYLCGYILDEEWNETNRVRVGIEAHVGDSGAGMKWEYTIDGILTDITDPAGDLFFQTAYHTQYTLGNGYFYFNCAAGETTETDPADWGVCPAVNR